jgi:hypothetical protein
MPGRYVKGIEDEEVRELKKELHKRPALEIMEKHRAQRTGPQQDFISTESTRMDK